MSKMLEIQGVTKIFYPGTPNENVVLRDLDLDIEQGDYVSVIGGNGAGKSTLLNSIAGVFGIDSGRIAIDGVDVTRLPEYKRAELLGRVFQDPMTGTAAKMSIEENLALAIRRGNRRTLKWGLPKTDREMFRQLLATLELGLEDRLSIKVGRLSGGQRQAITLMMATLKAPKLLLLDEHAAALDPKTAAKVMALTDRIVAENGLTTLMITHNMHDAIVHGNRLIMMDAGQVILDIRGAEKQKLTVDQLIKMFELAGGQDMPTDSMILKSKKTD
jgi:putative ABC transport system ATP-binding protein